VEQRPLQGGLARTLTSPQSTVNSVCANASAQGLAKLAAFMANKGELGKERMMSDYVAGHARCDKGCMAVGGRSHDAVLPGRGHQVPVW